VDLAGAMTKSSHFLRILLVGVVLAAAPRSAGSATTADTADPAIQLAVEQLRSGGTVTIEGAGLAARNVIADLYERGGFRHAWTAETAEELLRAVRGSADDGLDPADYHLAPIKRLRGAPSAPERDANLDLLLTDAMVRLAYHLRFGKVDPEQLDPHWNLVSELVGVDPATAMQQALDQGRVYEALEDLKPKYPFYARLKQALADYRRIEEAGGWPAVPAGPTLKPGMTDARVPVLRRRLAVTGDLPATAAGDAGSSYDATLEAAVKSFQERHGLTPDGAIGRTTIDALSMPVAQRIAQIRATLERCRWVMHDLPERLVMVNVAGFTVYFARDHRIVWQSPVVVGATYTKTPIFRADMKYIVVNPTWTVPPGMMRNEIGPAMRRDPGYLARKGFRMVNGQVVQPAGPKNALGRIKLMFPNTHSVYLHDTPAKSAFKATSRTFSHGCVRVEKPFELAALALDDPAWTTEALLAAAATGKTRTIVLKQPIPVLILYWTAAVGEDGRVTFLPDVYGRDPAVVAALGRGFSFRRRPVLPDISQPPA
jgi:murein L,D-transpeptidase YcbB/YkuD